jgi:hypothetical protein
MPDKIESNGLSIKFGPYTVKVILALAVLIAVFMGDSGAIPNF